MQGCAGHGGSKARETTLAPQSQQPAPAGLRVGTVTHAATARARFRAAGCQPRCRQPLCPNSEGLGFPRAPGPAQAAHQHLRHPVRPTVCLRGGSP